MTDFVIEVGKLNRRLDVVSAQVEANGERMREMRATGEAKQFMASARDVLIPGCYRRFLECVDVAASKNGGDVTLSVCHAALSYMGREQR